MRAGQVVRIRVSPKDCQSVLDLMEKIGLQSYGMSFAQCVSMALGSLLETARVNKGLPEPDAFQFLNRMQPFMGHSSHRKKLQAAEAIGGLGEHFSAPQTGMPGFAPAATRPRDLGQAGEKEISPPAAAPAKEPSPDQLKQRARLTELLQLEDMRALTVDERMEYQELYHSVYEGG